MTKVYIDGSYGTTGLAIKNRLTGIEEYEIVELDYENRKDLNARIEAGNSADIVITCLPNEATKEIAPHITVPLIDTSTEFRTQWVYGFPEAGLREEIKSANRIANPGCHATGFLAITVPLRKAGIIKEDEILSCTSITGYSGGGVKMIEEYENQSSKEYTFPRPYALGLTHKHLPEMKKIANLQHNPVFVPMVANNYSGMCVSVPLKVKESKEIIKNIFKDFYKNDKLVHISENNHPAINESGFLNPFYKQNYDDIDIIVEGNANGEIVIYALFDNLGKGAAGSAIQCLNLRCGNDEFLGLRREVK